MNLKEKEKIKKKVEKNSMYSPIISCVSILVNSIVLGALILIFKNDYFTDTYIHSILIEISIALVGIVMTIFFCTIFFIGKYIKKIGLTTKGTYKDNGFDDETIANIDKITNNSLEFYFKLFVTEFVFFSISLIISFLVPLKFSNILIMSNIIYSFIFCIKFVFDYLKILNMNLNLRK